jgi:hypothetical protein
MGFLAWDICELKGKVACSYSYISIVHFYDCVKNEFGLL